MDPLCVRCLTRRVPILEVRPQERTQAVLFIHQACLAQWHAIQRGTPVVRGDGAPAAKVVWLRR